MTATSPAPTRLSPDQIRELDPYALMGLLGKRVIHPGGRRATEQLLDWAAITAGERVLDAGCGVATTAIEVARRHDATVTALDLAPLMLERARRNVEKASLAERIEIAAGDIQDLPYPDATFDCVLAEAVTMFVDRPRAARELVRVCRPGGRVLATEFFWLRPPTEEARRIFLGEVCPGLSFDSVEDWEQLYADGGLTDVRSTTGAFDMLTVRGFVRDEGLAGSLRFLAQAATRASALRKLAWLMPRMARAVPYLGYIVVAGVTRRVAAHGPPG
ncbi:MAG: methyltransferase domain-containing protein [Egibacteraceae bacterium]